MQPHLSTTARDTLPRTVPAIPPRPRLPITTAVQLLRSACNRDLLRRVAQFVEKPDVLDAHFLQPRLGLLDRTRSP